MGVAEKGGKWQAGRIVKEVALWKRGLHCKER